MMVAIIMSVYKKDKALPLYWAMQSLLHQTYKNLLIFIRLDGDVETDVETLLFTLQKNYQNIILSRNSVNLGLGYSLNKLIDTILLDYPDIQFIARMDADDICHLSRIQRQVECLDKTPSIDVLGTACQEFGLYNRVITKKDTDVLLKKNILKTSPFIHPSVIFFFFQAEDGIRDPLNTFLSEDLALWLDLSLKGYGFGNLNEALLFYRINNVTLKRRSNIKKAISELIIRFRYLKVKKNNIVFNCLWIAGHLILKIMPVCLVRVAYRLFR